LLRNTGSPGIDEQCVMAGIDKVREQLKWAARHRSSFSSRR
jgi:hypothetical protein